MITITLIGTAALMPIPERALTAALISCGGHSILLDCGEGTQSAARKAGVSLMKTDLIALTHYHGDHCFGLPGLLQSMSVLGRTEALYITGPEGLTKELDPILRLTGPTAYDIRLIETGEGGLSLSELGWACGASLIPFKTEHRVASQGYCFTLERAGKFDPVKAKSLGVPMRQWSNLQKGQSVQIGDAWIKPEQVIGKARQGLKFVFTGDTSVCNSLIEAARGADLMICDATYGEREQALTAAEYGHMTFIQAAETAARAEVKELWLAHYSQMVKEPLAYLPSAKELFDNTVCGKDGLSKVLKFTEQTDNS